MSADNFAPRDSYSDKSGSSFATDSKSGYWVGSKAAVGPAQYLASVVPVQYSVVVVLDQYSVVVGPDPCWAAVGY